MVNKFVLNSDLLGEVILQDVPTGWDTLDKALIRDNFYMGVLRKQSAELRFHGDGLDYLNALWDVRRTEGIVYITIWKKKDFVDELVISFRGIGKLNPYNLQYEGTKPYVKISFEDSEIHNKILTLDDTEINVGLTTSIGGTALGTIPTQKIKIKQREILEQNSFGVSEGFTQFAGNFGGPVSPPYITSDDGFVFPVVKIEGETEHITTPSDFEIDGGVGSAIYPIQTTAAHIKLNLSVLLMAASLLDGSLVLRKYTGDYVTFVDTVIQLIETASYPTQEEHDINYNVEFDLLANQGFTILFLFSGSYTADIQSISLQIDVTQFFEELQTDCHYRHDYLKRLCQIITDRVDCFKSDLFGRVSLGYATNGLYSNNVVMSGLQIRGFDSPPKTTLKNTIKSIRSIFNVCFGIEKIGQIYKAVVEDVQYFFRGEVGITIHNCGNIERQVIDEFTFSSVNVGYAKAEYEETNGLEEYNNQSVYATPIKSAKGVLDLISVERADSHGREYARRKHKSIAASEDTRYDNDVFTDMTKEASGILETLRDEGFTDVSNILSPETAGGLELTPKRNMIRNGDWIRCSLDVFPDEYITFTSSNKASDLSTQKTGEAEPVVEQTNIQVKKLPASLWLNLKYIFSCELTEEQLTFMEEHPYHLVKFSPVSRAQTKKYFYGWILEVKGGADDRKGQCKILAANLLSERLHLVDPEGLPTEEEQSELPPQDDDTGGLELGLQGGLES